MKHSYRAECQCARCTKELERRTKQSGAAPVKHIPVKRERTRTHKPEWGSQEWVETRGDDLGESND